MIALDTNILIWGVKGVASPNREAMIPCAKALLDDLERNKQRIIIPSQVLAEFLVGYGDRDRIAALNVITKRYLVAPLDTKAALIAAELCHDKELCRNVAAEYGKTRQTIKADINVIASSVAVGASHLYASDGAMKKLAQGKIIVQSLEDIMAEQAKSKSERLFE